MIVFITVIGIVLLAILWVLVAPLTLCLSTDNPAGILMIELKGIMKFRIYLKDDGIFFHSRILFFKSEKELFQKGPDKVDRKKKLNKKKHRKSGVELSRFV